MELDQKVGHDMGEVNLDILKEKTYYFLKLHQHCLFKDLQEDLYFIFKGNYFWVNVQVLELIFQKCN